MLLIKSNNVIVVLILFLFLRALLQATLPTTIQSELFRLKIKKKGKQPQCSTSIYDYSYNNIVNGLNAPHIVEELWSTNQRVQIFKAMQSLSKKGCRYEIS